MLCSCDAFGFSRLVFLYIPCSAIVVIHLFMIGLLITRLCLRSRKACELRVTLVGLRWFPSDNIHACVLRTCLFVSLSGFNYSWIGFWVKPLYYWRSPHALWWRGLQMPIWAGLKLLFFFLFLVFKRDQPAPSSSFTTKWINSFFLWLQKFNYWSLFLVFLD